MASKKNEHGVLLLLRNIKNGFYYIIKMKDLPHTVVLKASFSNIYIYIYIKRKSNVGDSIKTVRIE